MDTAISMSSATSMLSEPGLPLRPSSSKLLQRHVGQSSHRFHRWNVRRVKAVQFKQTHLLSRARQRRAGNISRAKIIAPIIARLGRAGHAVGRVPRCQAKISGCGMTKLSSPVIPKIGVARSTDGSVSGAKKVRLFLSGADKPANGHKCLLDVRH